MNKRKLLGQIIVSTLLFAAVFAGGQIENEQFAEKYDKAASVATHQVSISEIKASGGAVFDFASHAPAKLVGAISAVNEASKYGNPIDEKSDSDVLQVHAAAGGMVLTSGWEKELGLFVKIKHEDAVTVYGNLSDLIVVENERVQRGEIIGSYKKGSEKEFFYELQENL